MENIRIIPGPTLPVNSWMVLGNVPHSPFFGVGDPQQEPRLWDGLVKIPLERIPRKKNPNTTFRDVHPINFTAAVLAATGTLRSEDHSCRQCREPQSGQWEGCVIPPENDVQFDGFLREVGFACANHVYQKEKSRCAELYKKPGQGATPDPAAAGLRAEEFPGAELGRTIEIRRRAAVAIGRAALDKVAVNNLFIAFTDANWADDDFLQFPATHPQNWAALARDGHERGARSLVYGMVSQVRREMVAEEAEAAAAATAATVAGPS